jgi:hypothetical protein
VGNAIFTSPSRTGERAINSPAALRIIKKLPLAAVSALALLIAGCNDPAEFLLWSPDGRHGLVVGGDEIALVDPAGSMVAKPFAPKDSKAPVAVEAWMPDSHRVIAVRSVKAKNWSEIAPLLGVERAQSVTRAADELLGIIREYHGDWEKFGDDDPKVKAWGEHLDFGARYSIGGGSASAGMDGIQTVLAYLRERHPAAIAPLLQTKEMIDESDTAPRIHELFIRSVLPGEAPGEELLVRSADVISWARPSPDGLMIAFVRNEPERPALAIVASHGGASVPVEEGTAQAAWTLDGQALVYQKTEVPFAALEKQAQLGTLTRRKVRDAAGIVPPKLADPENLAGILFSNEQNRVACLPDGRILFAGTRLRLPAVEDTRERTLFALRPGATPVIERVVADAAQAKLPGRIDRFTVSPDGRRVALPGGNGEVAVLSLETGDVTEIAATVADYNESSKYENSASRPAPTWRTADELCYIVPAGHAASSERRAEAVLQPLGGEPRAISRGWSDALTNGFLPRPKPGNSAK